MKKIELDLRSLPAPEPLHQVLRALEALEPGHELVALTPIRPQFLLDELTARGYDYRVDIGFHGDARVEIRRKKTECCGCCGGNDRA